MTNHTLTGPAAPDGPATATPPRRPGLVRRTTTHDSLRLSGLRGPVTLDARGRTDREIARAWVETLTTAIRSVDDRHMITVGVIPWAQVFKGAKPLFYATEVGGPLDFVSVHFYPKAGEMEGSLAAALNEVAARRKRCATGATRRARLALEHDDHDDAGAEGRVLEGEWLNYAAILVQVDRIVVDLRAPLPP